MATAAIEMRPLTISWDKEKKSFYALMPSQSGRKPHKVHFVEPRKEMPHTFTCDCRGFYFRLSCSHCDALKSYFREIYEDNRRLSDAFKASKPAPVAASKPATVDADKEQLAEEIDRLLAELEAECDAIVAELEAEMPTACPIVAPADVPVVSSSNQPVEGHFTVVIDSKQHTFRVERQDQDAKFAPGQMVISHMVGSNNESDYQGFAFVGDDGTLRVWRKARVAQSTIDAAKYLLSGDMPASGKAYALASGNCWRCNRLLTTPESIVRGLGPTCAGKVGLVRKDAAA